MTRIPTSSKTIAVGVAAALALGGGTAAVAAESGAPAKSPAAKAQKRAEHRAERQKEFAKALGVSVDDVKKARAEVREQGRERRAAAEKQRAEKLGITVDQLRDRKADRIAKRLEKVVQNGHLSEGQAAAVVAAAREGKPFRPLLKKLKAQYRKDHRPAKAQNAG